MHSPVAGDHLVLIISNAADDCRDQDAVLADAVDQPLHPVVVDHVEGMILERMDLGDFDFHSGFFSNDSEDFLDALQFDLLSYTFFHDCITSFVSSS